MMDQSHGVLVSHMMSYFQQKIEKLQANLHLLNDDSEISPPNTHTIFVDSAEEGMMALLLCSNKHKHFNGISLFSGYIWRSKAFQHSPWVCHKDIQQTNAGLTRILEDGCRQTDS